MSLTIILLTIAVIVVVITVLWFQSGRIPKPPALRENEWTNWACNQHAEPERIAQPSSPAGLMQLVQETKTGLRVVGAGHSFTDIVSTDTTLISLDKLASDNPVKSVDKERKTAWISAGARLRDLSPALAEHGLAFKNLGDINVQSFAGATATATHGTGKTFPCIAAEIRGVKILRANGEIVTATLDDNPDLVRAAQVSIGALGILLEAEVNVQEAYNLHRKVWIEPTDEILNTAHEKWETYRNFEFFYIPYSGHCACISHDETDAAETPREESEDEQVLMAMKQVRDFFRWFPALRRFIIKTAIKAAKTEEVIGESWKLLANQRTVRFSEMEYHLPPEKAIGALREVIGYLENKRSDCFFPIEVRQTAGDEAWLSPFQGGPRISIAVHAFYKETNDYFFDHIETIFLKNGGRPHWGKLHSLKASQLRELYPDFEKFRALRKEMDPDGKFLTPYLRQLFDE